MRTGVFLLLAFAVLGAGVASSAQGGSNSTEPLALLRAPRASDTLPARYRSPGLALAETRLVAAAPRVGSARLYLVQTLAGDLCEVLVYGPGRAAGSGCSPLATFFRPGSSIAAVSGRFFAGVAANDVERVLYIDRRGVRHQIGLSPDHGFIVGCNGPDGCACSVAWVEAYGAGDSLLSRDRWLAPRCWRRPL